MASFSRKSGMAILALMLVLAPGLVMAQGLDQTFEWPEKGFSLSYPAGWGTLDMGLDQVALLSDPNMNMDAEQPESPMVMILAFPSDLVAAMGDPAAVLGMLTEEFGVGMAVEAQTVTIAGMEAVRVTMDNTEDNMAMDIVMISNDAFSFVIVGIAPLGQEAGFTSTYDAILNSIVFSEPTGAVATTGILFTGVRITLDQTLTNDWNEIDAVELVGVDVDGIEVNQWAISAEATSSFGEDSWSATQATGAPDTEECGDYTTAWASETYNGQDTLTLTYGLPVIASEVNIYQTYNPGAIILVELLPDDKSMDAVAIFEGPDTTTACPGILNIPVSLGGGTIAMDTTVSGEITDAAPAQDWTFQASAGDAVTITMVATGLETLDPYVSLLDSSGAELTANDDAVSSSVGGLNSQIPGFIIPMDGTYTIRASRYAGSGTVGTYDLTLATGAGDALDSTLAPTYGEQTLASGFMPDPFSVAVTAGGPVDVSAALGAACPGFGGFAANAPAFRLQYTAGNFILRLFFNSEEDTTMVVNAPDGSWHCDDDTGGSLQPLLTFDPPLSGQYDIWVGTFSPGETAPGTLYITEMDITIDDVN